MLPIAPGEYQGPADEYSRGSRLFDEPVQIPCDEHDGRDAYEAQQQLTPGSAELHAECRPGISMKWMMNQLPKTGML